jgi:hypothetical protein
MLLDQEHGRRGGDRLRHRGDAEDRVSLDRVGATADLRADDIDVHLAPTADQCRDAGHVSVLDMARHRVAQAAEPRL